MKNLVAIIASSSLLVLSAHPSASSQSVGAGETEIHCDGQPELLATYLEMSQVLFNERKGELVGKFYKDKFISHNVDEGGIGVRKVALEDMQAMWRRFEQIEPDREVINNLIVCKDDIVVAQVTTTGTHIGEGLVGNPQEGRRYKTSAIDIYRFEDGKVVERWGNNDRVAKARQLGQTIDLSFEPIKPD